MAVAAGATVDATDIVTLQADTTGRPLVRLIQQSAQSMTNATDTAITFGASSEDIDTHGIHDTSTNTSRVTPALAGYYRCTATLTVASSAAVTQMYVAVGKNGTKQQPLVRLAPAATAVAKSVTATAILSANGTTDYFEAIGNQTSGGSLNTQASGGLNSTFEVEFLRPL